MIKIEVTGNSIAEVADKLLALGTSLHTAGSMFGIDAAVEPKKAAKAKPEAGKADDARNGRELALAAEKAAAPSNSAPVTATAETVPAPSEKPLDFDKDVAPVVLNAVKVHSKEWVQEVLSQFGVARASQVPDEQLAELLAALQAGPQ